MVSHNPIRSKPTPQPVDLRKHEHHEQLQILASQVADPTAYLSKDTVKALSGREVPTTSSNHPIGMERKAYHHKGPWTAHWDLASRD